MENISELQHKILEFIQDKGITQQSYERFCDERGIRYLDKKSFKEYRKSFNCELVELCGLCGFESEIKPVLLPQICSYCSCVILPCSLCVQKDCANCPLESIRAEMKLSLTASNK